ncbi:MAG: hypothetical protein DRG27_01445 [Deltaproteobacteria bacterium]|nr:MAG: hypothetical protein DRG27_01445 [Deltaproteobacteria bacterium]
MIAFKILLPIWFPIWLVLLLLLSMPFGDCFIYHFCKKIDLPVYGIFSIIMPIIFLFIVVIYFIIL